MTTKKRLGRLAAGASAFALVGVGLLGTAATAEPRPGEIDADHRGELTIHKYDGDQGGDGGDGTPISDTSGFGNALSGVEFTVTKIDLEHGLDTAEGWAEVEGYYSDPSAAPVVADSADVKVTVSGVVNFEDLEVGAYLVEETNSGPNLITAPVAPFIVTIPLPHSGGWLYDVNVYPKNQVAETPEPSKSASGLEGEAQTGDKVDWTISVPVPKINDGYSAFVVEDNPGSGLAFDAWGEIAINGVALDGGDYSVTDTAIELEASGLAKLNDALEDDQEVTLTAELTTTVLNAGELENEASIIINGKPLEDPKGMTNWGTIVVSKKSESENGAALPGVEFELYDGREGNLIGSASTDADGKITFTVWVGNDDATTRDGLYLLETQAPEGHVLPADPWFSVGTVTADEEAVVSLVIVNHKPEGPNLPLTGAQGTLLFTVVGLGLIGAGAAAVAVRRSRASH